MLQILINKTSHDFNIYLSLDKKMNTLNIFHMALSLSHTMIIHTSIHFGGAEQLNL